MSNFNHFDNQANLVKLLEAILFVSPIAVDPAQIAQILQTQVKEVEKGFSILEEQYAGRGIRLQWHQGKAQLITAPEAAQVIETYLGLEATSRLSRAALEALAIIAYQQPVTRPEIDAIRGVNSDGVLRSLLSKGLIEEAGRAERPGRPILYVTTSVFLNHFGLSSITELPPLPEPPLGQDSDANQETIDPLKE